MSTADMRVLQKIKQPQQRQRRRSSHNIAFPLTDRGAAAVAKPNTITNSKQLLPKEQIAGLETEEKAAGQAWSIDLAHCEYRCKKGFPGRCFEGRCNMARTQPGCVVFCKLCYSMATHEQQRGIDRMVSSRRTTVNVNEQKAKANGQKLNAAEPKEKEIARGMHK